MPKPVVTIADVQPMPMAPPAGSDVFGADISDIDSTLGIAGLGAMHVSVPPGKRAFPFHNHLANDEMFIILEGEGTYRFGDQEFPVKAGDVCGAPRGGPETAHQLINSGTGTLRYIGVSTQRDPDVVEYPDSGKFAALAVAPGPSFWKAHLRFVGRKEDTLDYWEGEET